MYIFYSILGLLCFGGMMFVDHAVLSRVSFKFNLLIKSVVFFLFSLLFIATKQSFEFLFDFVDLEWLILLAFVVLGLVIFVAYNLSVKSLKGSKTAILNISSILIFINIFFLIFYNKVVVNSGKVINFSLVIAELALLAGVILFTIFGDKENKKVNIIYILVSALALALMVFLIRFQVKDKHLFRQFDKIEILMFYMSVAALIGSILFFILYKDNKGVKLSKKERKIPWQHYVLVVVSAALTVMAFVFPYGGVANFYKADIRIVNLIMGLSYLVPVILEIVLDAVKTKPKFIYLIKNNGVLLGNSVLLAICLVLYTVAATIK